LLFSVYNYSAIFVFVLVSRETYGKLKQKMFKTKPLPVS
jgi:hypothetical protein